MTRRLKAADAPRIGIAGRPNMAGPATKGRQNGPRKQGGQDETDKDRLIQIRCIIEAVDNRCSAADGSVTPTLEEMTQEEISQIYALAGGEIEEDDDGDEP